MLAVRAVVVSVSVEVPEPFESDAGLKAQSAAPGKFVQERVTWLLKPLIGVTVTVAFPVLPATKVNVVGEVVTEKPAPVPVTVSVTATLAVRELEVPVTTTANEPEGVELVVAIVRVEEPEVVIVAGLNAQVTPVGKPVLHARVTVPVNPFSGVTEMDVMAGLPAAIEMLVGFAAML